LETRNTALSEEIDSRRRIEHALTRVLRTVPTAAFLVTPEGIAGANEAGGDALARGGALLEEGLRAAVASSESSNAFEVTATLTAGHFVVMRRGIGDEIERRIELAGRRWQLTARHRDVLRALVDGKSNAEIALSLGCTPRTVETHITALLERADAPSRLALVAAFWTDL
jgi:DNA-binding NarL/FixJ family response regulator